MLNKRKWSSTVLFNGFWIYKRQMHGIMVDNLLILVNKNWAVCRLFNKMMNSNRIYMLLYYLGICWYGSCEIKIFDIFFCCPFHGRRIFELETSSKCMTIIRYALIETRELCLKFNSGWRFNLFWGYGHTTQGSIAVKIW